jgi:hypothetical protein
MRANIYAILGRIIVEEDEGTLSSTEKVRPLTKLSRDKRIKMGSGFYMINRYRAGNDPYTIQDI